VTEREREREREWRRFRRRFIAGEFSLCPPGNRGGDWLTLPCRRRFVVAHIVTANAMDWMAAMEQLRLLGSDLMG
ncbi:hypothetical protein EJB05_29912, partial [Eragrostis curvula]